MRSAECGLLLTAMRQWESFGFPGLFGGSFRTELADGFRLIDGFGRMEVFRRENGARLTIGLRRKTVKIRKILRRIRKYALRAGAILMTLCLIFPILALPLSAEPAFYRFGDGEGKRIALTFDDGPHPKQTMRILSVLEKYDVKATFFMVGSNVGYYPEAAQAVGDAGHEIGNHTFLHRHLAGMNEGQLSEELRECAEAVERICGISPKLFRPPEGTVTPCVQKCAADAGYPVILWSIDTRDWQGRGAREIVNCVLSEVRPGSIVLMHDYIGVQSHTAEALESILPALLDEGYAFVTVSELLSLG